MLLTQKLKNKQVDDLAALEEIGRSIAVIVKKLVSIIGTDNLKIPGSSRVDSNSLIPLGYLKNLPRLVAVKFSPLNYVLDRDVTTELGKLLLTLINTPRNLIPPFPCKSHGLFLESVLKNGIDVSVFGLIVQGQHIFTFDGKQLTFPGKCNYLLARDALNGNFTLAGSYKDGLLASITLADKHDSVTLLAGGKVKANQGKFLQNVDRQKYLFCYL